MMTEHSSGQDRDNNWTRGYGSDEQYPGEQYYGSGSPGSSRPGSGGSGYGSSGQSGSGYGSGGQGSGPGAARPAPGTPGQAGAAGPGMPTAPVWQATPGQGSQGQGASAPGASGPGASGPGLPGHGLPGPGGYGPWLAPGGVQPMGPPAGASRGADTRGFLSALFDFSFTSFVTTRIIKVLYVLITVLVCLTALFYTILAFRVSAGFGIVTLIIGDPLFIVIVMAFWRLVLEAFVVVFRIAEDVRAIRERGGR